MTSSFGLAEARRMNLIHSPLLHIRRISTAPLSARRDDWTPEHAKSWNPRGSPSRYKIVLELMVRPSVSVFSKVNTSPFGCGSIRTVRLFGGVPSENVDLVAFIFQVPCVCPK